MQMLQKWIEKTLVALQIPTQHLWLLEAMLDIKAEDNLFVLDTIRQSTTWISHMCGKDFCTCVGKVFCTFCLLRYKCILLKICPPPLL